MTPDTDDEVVVTGSRTEEEANRAVLPTTLITREEISRSGARTLADLLEMVPGVQVVEGRAGPVVQVRGSEPDHVLLVVDGARVVGRVDGGIDLRRLPVEDIEQIEIVPGAGSTAWGADALGGVIQIRTRRPRQGVASSLSLESGRALSPTRNTDAPHRLVPLAALDSADLVARVEGGTPRLRAGITAGRHSGAPWDQTPEDAGTTGDGWRQTRLAGQIEANPNEDLHIEVRGETMAYRRTGVDATPTGAVIDRDQSGQQVIATLAADRTFPGHRFSTLWSASRWADQLRQNQRSSDRQDSLESLNDTVAQGRIGWTVLGEEHQVDLGVEGQYERLLADRIDDGEARRSRAGAWIQHRWSLPPSLTLHTSVRVDADAWFGVALSPRVAFVAFPSPVWTVRASAGRGFAAPDPREMFLDFSNAAVGYRVLGNPNLKPESGWGGQGSVTARPGPGWLLEGAGSIQAIRGLIQPESDDGVRFVYTNVGSALLAQGSASIRWDPVAGVRITGDLTRLHAVDLETGLQLDNRSRWQGGGSLDLDRAGLGGLTTRFLVSSPRSFTLTDGLATAPTLGMLDLRATTRPQGRLSLAIGVDNLLDAGRGQGGLAPTRPRRIYLALEGRHSTKERP